MIKTAPGSLLPSPFTALLLILVVNPGHAASLSRPHLHGPAATTTQAQCQAACPLLPSNAKKAGLNTKKDIQPDPNPPLPYYASAGYLAAASVLFAVYLFGLVRTWRPPDRVVLYGSYRI